jgi:hypothetical protein
MMETRIADMAIPLTAIVASFHKLEEHIFDSNGGGWGWAPLADVTAEYKASKEYPEETLWRTMDLRNSLVGTGEGAVSMISPFEAMVGTDVVYAQYHEDGTETMRARPIIPQLSTLETLLTTTVQAWIDSGDASVNVSDFEMAGPLEPGR